MSYVSELKKLINGEMVASMQYKIIAESLVGEENFSYLKDHCEEHYKEELEHYSKLVSALMQRGYRPDLSLDKIISEASPSTTELDSSNTDNIRKFFEESEKNAIESYEEFHESIKDEDPDLDDLVISIIQDEKEHKLDFARLKTDVVTDEEQEEDESPVYNPFSPSPDDEKEEEEEDESEEERKEESLRRQRRELRVYRESYGKYKITGIKYTVNKFDPYTLCEECTATVKFINKNTLREYKEKICGIKHYTDGLGVLKEHKSKDTFNFDYAYISRNREVNKELFYSIKKYLES